MTSTGNGLNDDCDSAMDDKDDDDGSATSDNLDNEGDCARREKTMIASAQRSTTTTAMAMG